MVVAQVTLDDGGDLIEGVCDALGKMNGGLPNFRPCWETGDSRSDMRAEDRSKALAQNLQACIDAGGQAGVHLGAGARRLFPTLTVERVGGEELPPIAPVPAVPAPPAPPPPVAIEPMAPVTLPKEQALRVRAEMGHRFGSDSAMFYGSVPPEVNQFLQTALSRLATGQARALDLNLTSVGAITTGLDGKPRAAAREAASYDAVDGRPGNAAATRKALERDRSVRASFNLDGQGRATATVTASCDMVQSLLSVSHLRSPGRERLQQLLHKGQFSCGGKAVRLTDNDGLAAMRAFAAGIKVQKAAYLAAILGDTRLGPAERLQRSPGEGGSWAPDLARKLQAGTITEDQAVLAAMSRPALQKVLGKPPTVQLCRLGADGKPHPILVHHGKTGKTVPLSLTAQDGITLLSCQTQTTPPSRRAVGRSQTTAEGGGVRLADLTKSLQGKPGQSPNAISLSGQEAPLELGGPVGQGEDAAVVAMLAHVDDPADVAALRQSSRQIETDLQQIAGWCRQGVLNGGGLDRQAQLQVARALDAYLKQPDTTTLAECRQQILHAAGGGETAGFAQALIHRVQAGCRLQMALRALPAERQAPTAVQQ
jgi:hypothetical protein